MAELAQRSKTSPTDTALCILCLLIAPAAALTVHQTVHYSAPVFNKLFKNHRVRALGPTVLGLSLIPFFVSSVPHQGGQV